MRMWFEPTHHYTANATTPTNRKSDPIASIGGCISNWGAHGLLKRGLRRWGSTGSWVCFEEHRKFVDILKYFYMDGN